MRYKTSKLAKLERNRTSVFTEDLYHCYFCQKQRDDLHEIIYGKNRINSIKNGFVLPLCREHHQMFHDNHQLTKTWIIKCQQYFEQEHTRKDWLDIFHKNYIQKN